MVRKAKKQAITPQMYRHFAACTLVATVMLAMMTDGENQQALADELEDYERQQQLQAANAKKFGEPQLIVSADMPTRTYNSNGDYHDVSTQFGAPMDRAGATVEGSVSGTSRRSSTTEISIDYAAMGLTKEEFEKLSPAEQRQLLSEFRSLRQRQTRSLIEGSMARGGGSGLEI